jgi:hypothetical protein
MKPKIRKMYLLGLASIFIVVIPVLVLFSTGYRLDSRFRLVKTGGIYLVNDESGLTVTLDGKIITHAGMFGNNILIRNLLPKAYSMTVEKKGCRPWKRNVTVEEQKVEICYPLLIPLELNRQLVPKYIAHDDKKNTRELNEEYTEALNLFRTYEKPAKGIIPVWVDKAVKKIKLVADRRLKKKVLLSRHGNSIFVQWTGSDAKRPFFIGSSEKQPVYSGWKKIHSFGFFPERHDSLLVLLEDHTLYAVGIDTRYKTRIVYRIVSNCNRFAVMDEYVYYFSGKNLYRIDFEP